jgi:hypothetical protein
LGSFARKKFRKQNDYGDAREAEIETDQTNGCESTTPEEIDDDDDLPIANTLSWKKTFENQKRNQKQSVPKAGIEANHTDGHESTEPEEIDDDDDLPIAKTLSGNKTYDRRKRNQKERVPKAGIDAEQTNGHGSTEPEEIDDDDDDDLPIANTLSWKKTYESLNRHPKESVPTSNDFQTGQDKILPSLYATLRD